MDIVSVLFFFTAVRITEAKQTVIDLQSKFQNIPLWFSKAHDGEYQVPQTLALFSRSRRVQHISKNKNCSLNGIVTTLYLKLLDKSTDQIPTVETCLNRKFKIDRYFG